MRLKIIFRPVLLLCCVVALISPATWAVDPADKGRKPIPKPDPRARDVPELVCTGDRTVTIVNSTLETKTEDSPLRLRIAGNLLYLGESSASERFFATIHRVARRRWASGTATLILDEALAAGVWTDLTLDVTRTRALRCEPFGALSRP